MQRNYFIPTRESLEELIDGPLPLNYRRGILTVTRYRDLDLDTPSGDLAELGADCHLRILEDGSALLRLAPGNPDGVERGIQSIESRLHVVDLREALERPSEARREVGRLVDLSSLKPRMVLDIEQMTQRVHRRRLFGPHFKLVYSAIRVSAGGFSRDFGEMIVQGYKAERVRFEEFISALEQSYSLRRETASTGVRARRLLSRATSTVGATAPIESRELTVLPLAEGMVALRSRTGTSRAGEAAGNLESVDDPLELPSRKGSGGELCDELLQSWLKTDRAVSTRLATLPQRGGHPILEVWLARLPERVDAAGVRWIPIADLLDHIGGPGLRDRPLIAALHAFARAAEGELWTPGDGDAQAQHRSTRDDLFLAPPGKGHDRFLNGELSQIEFNARVLALAENPKVPLFERFRFLAIVTANLDELYMVRVAALKHALAEGENRPGADGLTAIDQLELISIRARRLMQRQYRCLREQLLPALAARGIHILDWGDLNRQQHRELRAYFDDQIFPLLTPHALTISPGHPFPRISNLDFSLAAILRDPRRPDAQFAHVRVPSDLPRFVRVPNSQNLIPLEKLIAANYGALYPQQRVEEIHAFRVTRSGTFEPDEAEAVNLLDAVEREVKLRSDRGVLRIEIDRRMPRQVRELLLRELAVERLEKSSLLSRADLYEVEELVDLRGLEELGTLEDTDLRYPPFEGMNPLDPGRPIFELMAERDLLVLHPYQCFESSVERLLVEAAQDPQVVAIKLTHYRAGSQSRILSALLKAAERGVDTSVFVELKARFDEEINVEWARRLEEGGVHVVHGLVGLKTHAKTALIVRREGEQLKRYAHFGTGNYNATTARLYTDLSLLTANDDLTADVHDFFNELTGSAIAPSREYRELLVAPSHLLTGLVDRIQKEAEHARAGRESRIRAKLNGLADRSIIEALYEASEAGVQIDLIVRGICLLRPGVPSLSENIRVISLLGRFLEHSRIFHFANGGDPEYFISSADWRARNLRRRVEVAAPVADPRCQAVLDKLLALEISDPSAWELQADGSSIQREALGLPPKRSTQEKLIALSRATAAQRL